MVVSNVIYEFVCASCSVSYVGETERHYFGVPSTPWTRCIVNMMSLLDTRRFMDQILTLIPPASLGIVSLLEVTLEPTLSLGTRFIDIQSVSHTKKEAIHKASELRRHISQQTILIWRQNFQ